MNPILHPSRRHGRYYQRTLMREQFELIADRYVRAARPGTLVDLGCGDTPYRTLFEPHVERYLGVDLPGSEYADLCLTPDGAAPLDDGAAGVVLSTQVLEHVGDPAGYLRECRRLLRPGGLLILSTHGVWKYHPHPVDYWRWTGAGLRRLVESEGFEVRHWRGLMGLACCGLLLLQDAIVTKLPKRLRTPTAFVMQRLGMAADRLHTREERDTEASVFCIVAAKAADDEPGPPDHPSPLRGEVR